MRRDIRVERFHDHAGGKNAPLNAGRVHDLEAKESPFLRGDIDNAPSCIGRRPNTTGRLIHHHLTGLTAHALLRRDDIQPRRWQALQTLLCPRRRDSQNNGQY